jgi:hypothetical protein
MMTYYKGDRRPSLALTLKRDGAAVDLSTATSVNVRMVNLDTGALKFSSAATVTTALTGETLYSWGATDLNTVGRYKIEGQATWPTALVETFDTEVRLEVRDLAV